MPLGNAPLPLFPKVFAAPAIIYQLYHSINHLSSRPDDNPSSMLTNAPDIKSNKRYTGSHAIQDHEW